VVKTWNGLPAKVVNSKSVNAFKNAYDLMLQRYGRTKLTSLPVFQPTSTSTSKYGYVRVMLLLNSIQYSKHSSKYGQIVLRVQSYCTVCTTFRCQCHYSAPLNGRLVDENELTVYNDVLRDFSACFFHPPRCLHHDIVELR